VFGTAIYFHPSLMFAGKAGAMDKLQLTGRNLVRVFNSRLCRMLVIGHGIVHITKQPDLNLKTWPKQLLGYLPFAFAFPTGAYQRGSPYEIPL